jgi:hypothetical protein
MKEPSGVPLHGGRDEYGPYLGSLYFERYCVGAQFIAPANEAASHGGAIHCAPTERLRVSPGRMQKLLQLSLLNNPSSN